MAAKKTNGWRADKHVDFRANGKQIETWKKRANRERMSLGAWIRRVLDEASK